MKKLIQLIAMPAVAIVYVSCSQVKFSKDPTYKPCQNSGQACISQNGRDYFDQTETVEGGKVDILIVDDNSASMSYEQAHLAARFNNFISSLDQKFINYHIGIVTSDISASSGNAPRQVNGNGALQDGNLITFQGGSQIMTRDSGSLTQKDQMFKNAIQRPETLACEQYIINWYNSGKSMNSADYSNGYYANCPSGDERGIYAANLTIKNNPQNFIRPEADLAVIVLSDEDVRSQLYYYNVPGYALEDLDKSQTLINNVKSMYPTKNFSAHSIITKDATCLSTQNAQTLGLVGASYGTEYANLSNLTGGVVGDICATDYTTQLSQIFNNVVGRIVDKLDLACSNPTDLTVTLSTNDPSITWTVVGKEVRFNKKVPVGTSVNWKYSCPTL